MITKSEIQKQLRKHGLTMEEASEKMGVSRTTFYSYLDKIEGNELSSKLMDAFFSTFKFDDEFIKKVKHDREENGFSLDDMIDDFKHEGGAGLEGKYFNGTIWDTKAVLNLLTFGLPKSRYRILHVYSNYMSPVIQTNDFVIVEFVDSKFLFNPSDYFIYFIIAKNKTYLARILKKDDKWLLKMDKQDEIITFDPSDIIGLYLVRRIYQQQDPAPKMFEVSKQ